MDWLGVLALGVIRVRVVGASPRVVRNSFRGGA